MCGAPPPEDETGFTFRRTVHVVHRLGQLLPWVVHLSPWVVHLPPGGGAGDARRTRLIEPDPMNQRGEAISPGKGRGDVRAPKPPVRSGGFDALSLTCCTSVLQSWYTEPKHTEEKSPFSALNLQRGVSIPGIVSSVPVAETTALRHEEVVGSGTTKERTSR